MTVADKMRELAENAELNKAKESLQSIYSYIERAAKDGDREVAIYTLYPTFVKVSLDAEGFSTFIDTETSHYDENFTRIVIRW